MNPIERMYQTNQVWQMWHSVRCLVVLGLAIGCLGLSWGCGSEGTKCTKSEECGTGFYCRTDGVCKAGCRLSIECPVGKVCRTNQCIELQKDEDEDGFPAPLDCDDKDRLVNGGADEICGNKKDDNCDGQIDEEGCIKVDCRPGDTRDCYDGKENTLTFPGTRCRKGRQVCGSTGVWGDCQGQVLPSPEICDNVDNDCNGKIDDGEEGKLLTRSCYSGPAETRGQGSCKDGAETCEKGAWSTCQGEAKPTDETCDGIDNNCDGKVDNAKGVDEPCDTGQKGICQAGKQACDIQQKKVVCVASAKSSKELCGNKADDDCDGIIDNGCPYTPIKIADVRSFPHYVAVDDKHAAISLRDTKRVIFFGLAGGIPTLQREVELPEAPHGVQLDGTKAYATTEGTLYEIEITTGAVSAVATFSGPSHAGGLLLLSGRTLTRKAENSGTSLLGQLCQTDLSAKKTDCASLNGTFQKIGVGLVTSGVFALVGSDLGLHFVDTVILQEVSTRHVKIADGVDDFTIDDKTGMAIALSVSSRSIHIVDLAKASIATSLLVTDADGKAQTPGRVVAADGFAYIGHRDGRLISVLDIAQAKVIRRVDVCLAPAGLTLSQKPPQQGRTLWVTCPGDNTLWTMSTEP